MRAEVFRISAPAEKAAVWYFGFFHFANKEVGPGRYGRDRVPARRDAY